MNFDARSDNIRGLLTNTRTYKIPRFQRDFSWDQNNYNEFLNDMLSQISYIEDTLKFETSKYYLGNMLFLGNKEDDEVEVVDGQQRLTTITILLAAIRNTLFKITDSKKYSSEHIQAAKDYADTIQNDYLIKKIDGAPQRKIKTTTSYPYFTQTIQDYHTRNVNVEPSTEEEELLEATFNFFLKELKEENFLKKISNFYKYKFKTEHYVNSLKALRDQLLGTEIIDVFVSDKEQANRIFENINSKGKPLSQVDLIKNSIFSRINTTSAGVDEISIIWADLKQQLLELDTTFNEFFLHYWRAIYPEDSPNGKNLYKKFNKRFALCTETELKNFVDELKNGLSYYKKIVSPDRNDFTRKELKSELDSLVAINRFKGIQVRPALLAFYIKNDQLGSKKVPQKVKSSFLQFISNFHFIAFGTNLKLRSNKATIPYNNFIKNISKARNKKEVQDAINEIKRNLIAIINKEEFLKAFSSLEFSKKTARTGYDAFPASYAIRQLANFYDSRDYDDDEYSIEHILDESIGKTQNIGNLIVLEEKLNKESNEIKKRNKGTISFDAKKAVYLKSKYTIVENFCTENTEFTRNNIEQRANQLGITFFESIFN